MPVARRALRQIVGCARRSPIEIPEDAGSTPATSTSLWKNRRSSCSERFALHRLLSGAAKQLQIGATPPPPSSLIGA